MDPHQGSREDPTARTLDQFLENLQAAGVRDAVQPMVMTSEEASRRIKGPIELLFIDGDHSLEGAAADAEIWLPRLMAGGTVLMHDVATSGYSGPRRVFQQRICWSRHFHNVGRVGSMTSAQRTDRRSAAAAIRGTIVGILLYWYDVQGVIKRALRRARGALRGSRSSRRPAPYDRTRS